MDRASITPMQLPSWLFWSRNPHSKKNSGPFCSSVLLILIQLRWTSSDLPIQILLLPVMVIRRRHEDIKMMTHVTHFSAHGQLYNCTLTSDASPVTDEAWVSSAKHNDVKMMKCIWGYGHQNASQLTSASNAGSLPLPANSIFNSVLFYLLQTFASK